MSETLLQDVCLFLCHKERLQSSTCRFVETVQTSCIQATCSSSWVKPFTENLWRKTKRQSTMKDGACCTTTLCMLWFTNLTCQRCTVSRPGINDRNSQSTSIGLRRLQLMLQAAHSMLTMPTWAKTLITGSDVSRAWGCHSISLMSSICKPTANVMWTIPRYASKLGRGVRDGTRQSQTPILIVSVCVLAPHISTVQITLPHPAWNIHLSLLQLKAISWPCLKLNSAQLRLEKFSAKSKVCTLIGKWKCMPAMPAMFQSTTANASRMMLKGDRSVSCNPPCTLRMAVACD